MLEAVLDTKSLENKLKIFSSGLGNIYNELLNEVGKKMTAEARANAPRKTGKLANSINFIFIDKDSAALTTKKKINKSNVWYSNIVEFNRTITAKKKDYLIFKINGEWKKVKSVSVRGKPFMRPVWENYFGDSGKGYKELAEALQRKMSEAIG